MLHLRGRRTGVAELAFSPDGARLLAAGRGGVHVWDLRDPGAKPLHLPAEDPYHGATGAALFPDGRLFFNDSGAARVVGPGGGETAVPMGLPGAYNLVPAPDGGRVAAAGRYANVPAAVWRLPPDGRLAAEWSEDGAARLVRTAAFSPDSARVAVAEVVRVPPGWVNALSVRDAGTGDVLLALHPPTAVPDQLVFAPDGGRLVARSGMGLTVYDLAAPGNKPKRVANPDRPHFSAAAFHPHGRLFATVTTDRLVRLWDTDAWLPGATFTWDIGKLYAVAFSPDGATCAAGSHTGRVLVWDV